MDWYQVFLHAMFSFSVFLFFFFRKALTVLKTGDVAKTAFIMMRFCFFCIALTFWLINRPMAA